jgi:hypothetical protein
MSLVRLHVPIGKQRFHWSNLPRRLMMSVPRIESVTISTIPREPWDPLPVVTATFSDGVVKQLFSYFPDEISFLPDEFIGMTEDEARELKAKKDSVYLKGGYHPR